jgi:hypothetical protein
VRRVVPGFPAKAPTCDGPADTIHAEQLGDPAGIAPVSLDRHGRQRCLDVPRLQQHGCQAGLVQPVVQPLRQRTRLQADPRDRQVEAAYERHQRLRLARNLGLPDDLASHIEHAQAAQLQRHVDANVVLHDRPPDGRTRTARTREITPPL